jgi:putative NADH-flavin reductase
MPVIIIGADTEVGAAIVEALLPRQGEVRVFVTDPDAARDIKGRGAKVALGDVSDGSHIGAAALSAFAAVLIAEAVTDDRERSFATDEDALFAEWAEALSEAAVHRAIWVGDDGLPEPIAAAVAESATVAVANRAVAEIAAEVAELDEAATLG